MSVERILSDATFHAQIEERVARAESRTDAEVVVALAPRSAAYGEGAALAGALLALVALALVVYVPHVVVPHRDVAPLVLLAYVLGHAVAARTALGRALAGRARVDAAIARAASLAFFEEHVAATAPRTGLLVYVSVAEKRIRLLPDTALAASVPITRWDELVREHEAPCVRNLPGGVIALVDAAGEVLAKALPKTTHAENELSNAPRVRP